MLNDFLMQFDDAALGLFGGSLIFGLLLVLLWPLLWLIAVWRIGTGTQQTGLALMHMAKAHAESSNALLTALYAKNEALLAQNQSVSEQVLASKTQGEALQALAKQFETAVQWYVHDLQNPPSSKATKK